EPFTEPPGWPKPRLCIVAKLQDWYLLCSSRRGSNLRRCPAKASASVQDGFLRPISDRTPCTVRMYGRLVFNSSGSASSDLTASARLPNAPYKTVIDGC